MRTLLALMITIMLASCGQSKEDPTVDVTDTLNASDTAAEMLDTIGDSINIMRKQAENDSQD